MATQPTDSKPEIKRKVVPLGKALNRTDADYDEMLSPANLQKIVDDAKEDWRENAPNRFKNLLDAEPTE